MKEKNLKIISILEYVIEFIVAFILTICIQKILISKTNLEHIRYRYIILSVIFLIMLLVFIIRSIKNDRKKIEKMFLTFMIPIGLLYFLFVIPNRTYDEAAHVYRAYNISKGIIIEKKDEQAGNAITSIPIDVIGVFEHNAALNYSQIVEAAKQHTDYNKERLLFGSAQGYSPTLYMFTSIVFKIGRDFNVNFVILLYVARLCNFIFFLILGYLAIKSIPLGKLVMFVYLFNPMVVHQAVSVSPDSIIDSLTLFFIAYLIKLIKSKENINIKEKGIFGIVAILISIAKYVYFPIVFIAIVLLLKKENITKRDKIFIVVIEIISLLFAITWYLVSSRYVDLRVVNSGINSIEQIKYIIMHPFEYVKVLIKTTYDLGEKVITEFLGYRISAAEAFTSIPCLIFYAILLVSSTVLEKNEEKLDLMTKAVLMSVFLVLYILVLTGLYLIWSRVGAPVIADLQGRYFIPIFILPLLCVIKKDKYLDYDSLKVNVVYSLMLVIVNIQTLVPTIQQILHS